MTELLISAQMRAIENAAIESGSVTGLHLMERAGRAVVDAIFEEWPELRTRACRAVVLCGPGNNGGDGFVVARLLRDLGWQIHVLAAKAPGDMPSDAAHNAKRWLEFGRVVPLTCESLHATPPGDLYVDAIFGTGLSRAPEGEIAAVLAWLGGGDRADLRNRLLAIDAPSGLCLDSGRSLIACAEKRPVARLTVTFDSPKTGHVLDSGPAQCGRLVVKDIGIAPWRQMLGQKRDSVLAGLVERGPAEKTEIETPGTLYLDRLSKHGPGSGNGSHKFTYGHALILSGGIASGGAARLAARGALRIGAGLVSLGCPPSAILANAAQLDAVMLKPIRDSAALKSVLQDARINALCLGPGLGLNRGDLVAAALEMSQAEPRAVVLDADALTLIARDGALFDKLHERCILTPHAGEFARLFPDIAARLAAPAPTGPAYSKVDATREAARRAGCVVLFKGPATVVADAVGRCAVNAAVYERAAPWLATAGAGDVLAGFVAGLLARGQTPFEAACAAAWLHVECARSFGPGLIAEDLPVELPKVFRALGI
ncbi:NAD(P)H-hydrate dehydratase [Pseudorhodobacter sp.]|uniref:NAD(P)H-hydrate dehydratase n=1 Tax=Pseudorhodobacter sp. TaxID=1934400 RepID=UPI002AFFC01E|nr:NAD(P)H-hydrate dehydratase [Pseudorhodobacter sp.]